MSTGESDYAKRVVELSMQLANSRADVENLRMRIKAVDKEHEQLKKDRADMADRIDAALRRAKAEGRIKSMWEAVHIANTYNCDHNHGKKATEAVDNVLLKLYDRIAELEADARAAQIEEGVNSHESIRDGSDD